MIYFIRLLPGYTEHSFSISYTLHCYLIMNYYITLSYYIIVYVAWLVLEYSALLAIRTFLHILVK